MERYQPLALLVTRIYGATFVALGTGSGIAAATMLFLGPNWIPSAKPYFATAAAHFIAAALIIGLSRKIAAFAAKP